MRIATRLVLAGLALMAAGGCSRKLEDLRASQAKAETIWQQQERAVDRAVNGHFEEGGFGGGRRFFKRLTGIEVHGELDSFGWVPTPETKSDLEQLRLWHRRNKHRLYYDEATKRVKMLPPPVISHASRVKAQKVWVQQQQVIETAAQRKLKTDLEKFGAACIFFSEVAGIEVPGDASPVIDWYPTHETIKAVQPIRDWYRVHKNQIYWEEETKTVQVQQ